MVLDIGCGRGEWLELMQDKHISAKGIDLDEGMLEAGLSLGLNMEKGDGIEFLRSIEDESAIAITSFHVVEHISFDHLHDLVNEARRVLKPGGVLILETPNPENIRVACETFYLDPTHTKPIPSGLLSFVTQYYGYARSKVIRLQELEFLKVQKYANIAHLIENVSPDYAVVAQKEANQGVISLLDQPFTREYGISLAEMIEKFERRMIRFEELSEKMIKKVAQAEEFAWKAEIQATQAQQSAEQAWHHYQLVANSYQLLINSWSWKTTKPLRGAIKLARHSKNLFKRSIRSLFKTAADMIHRSPKVEKILLRIVNRFPYFKEKMKQLVRNQNFQDHPEGMIKMDSPKLSSRTEQKVSSDLKKEIEQKRKGK